MSKQAKKSNADLSAATKKTIEELRELSKSQSMDLQMRFSKFSLVQRSTIGQYLNAYNLAAWIYNELIDDDCRVYIDLAMKYTMETQKLSQAMRNVSEDPNEVQQIVNDINYGE